MAAPFIAGRRFRADADDAKRVRQLLSRGRGLLVLWSLACILPALAQQPAIASVPKPAAQIDLASLGYTGLSQGARLSGIANVTLDFLDAQHALLTFNPKRLFKRLPDCPPTHNDRVMHAAVLELPSGKVVKETDWYLHDNRRYLWPLSSGRFLLRRLNQLYEVDSNLSEKLALDSPKDLQWVSVTPDGKQIIAETVEQNADEKSKDKDKDKDKDKNKARVRIAFIDTDLLAVQRVMESRGMINLHATDSGFADVHETGAGIWLVRFGPALRNRVNITRVRARRSPNILYSSANTLLVGRCANSSDSYIVSAFTVTGTNLWKQRWSECRYTPSVAGSEDGSRFAVATLTIPPPSASGGPENAGEESEERNVGQTVQVFDTASGGPVISVKATPPVLDGHNFSLSSDGTQLAVLEGSTLNIYCLREMSEEERTKYAAVKSDIPVPYAAVPQPDGAQSAPPEEVINISAVPEEAAPEDEQSPAASAATPPTPAAGVQTANPAAAAKPAPTAASATPPPLTLRTGTQVVAVDVVVTDSRGHLIKGLQQSDFAVAEDNKPQSVRYFKDYAGGQPGGQTPAPQPEKKELAPNIFSNYSQPVEAGAVTVVLFDLLNTDMANQAHAQAELVRFLKTKPKDSQFALCVLGSRLQMIQGFTQDENTLLAAAQGKKASMRRRPLFQSDSPFEAALNAGKATTQFLPQLDFFVESLALQEAEVRGLDADRRMYTTVDAFAQLARYLSGIPGRKNLVWLSGSFTLGLAPDPGASSPFLEERNYSENLKKVSNLLAEAHVAVYPVDVKGIATDPLFTATTNDVLATVSIQGSTPLGPSAPGGAVQFAGNRRNANTAVPIAMMQNQAEQFGQTQIGEHATMDQLAAETGGRAFYNTNGIAKAIDTAAEEGANYYALSYTPTNKNYNGGFRKVKVSIAGKKYNLAYRKGYYAIDPYAVAKPAKDLMSGLAMAAMQHGSPQSRQIVFGARVVPVGKPRIVKETPPAAAKPAKNKHKAEQGPVEMQLYSIDYAVTSTDLRFSQASDGLYHDVLNFMITAFDDEGKLGVSQISQVAADVKPEVFQNIVKTGMRLHQEVDVPARSASLRLGVEDAANSHIGTLEIPLPVKAPADAPAVARRSMPPIERD